MTTVILTNTNLENEIRTIKALESKLQELKELKVEEILKSQQAAYDRYLQR